MRALLLALALGIAGCATLDSPSRAVAPAGCDAANPPSPLRQYTSAAAASRLLWVHRNSMVDIYCGCRFRPDQTVIQEGCALDLRDFPPVMRDIQWERVIPEEWFGSHRACWKEAPPRQERKHCAKVDPEYAAMAAELRNLQPAIGKLAQLRGSHPYGEDDEYAEQIGSCEFFVARTETGRLIIPPREARGDIGRTYFYMADKYGSDSMRLPPGQLELFGQWTRDDKRSAWERERNCRLDAMHRRPASTKPEPPEAETSWGFGKVK